MIAADFAAIRTTDDQGNDIPRYTNFRAVIDLADIRRYPHTTGGTPTVRIVADDAQADLQGHPDNPAVNIVETELEDAQVDDLVATIADKARAVLATEGFDIDGVWGWGSPEVRTAKIAPSRNAGRAAAAKAEEANEELTLAAHHLVNMLTTWVSGSDALPQHVKASLDATRACLTWRAANRSGWDYLPDLAEARQS